MRNTVEANIEHEGVRFIVLGERDSEQDKNFQWVITAIFYKDEKERLCNILRLIPMFVGMDVIYLKSVEAFNVALKKRTGE